VLPTFVIGLREGLEAALIVGIVAAFLVQEGRRDAMRWVWTGVAIGVLVSIAVGVGLRIAAQELPQRQQEQLETVVALVAVSMVTWMIFWMRGHAAGLKGELRDRAGAALATGSTAALVTMAFLAVIREGFETAVFLVAVFNDASDPQAAGIGAVLGIVVAVVIGYAIYRGGVRLDLGRFFKFTALVLVVVAAGLVSNALHTAHEAGWWNSLLGQAADLSAVVTPGTVRYALFNGMFGIQPQPTVGEALVWFLYAIPMTWVVLRPSRSRGAQARANAAVTATRATAAVVVAVTALAVFAVAAGAATKTVAVELTDAGCPKRVETTAGTREFTVKNIDASAVTEFEVLDGKRVIGEKENLTPGLSGSFTVKLSPGRYTTYCPNGDRERGVLVVTGAGSAASKTAAGKATKVAVTLAEFTVKAKPASLAAGPVDFVVKNTGSMTHEFVVARSLDGTLPLAADGTVDEDRIAEVDRLGELEDLGRGDKAVFAAGTLTPGTYVLFCNVVHTSGGVTERHYAEGMHTTFTVK
jgi:high-affinity iron transporter